MEGGNRVQLNLEAGLDTSTNDMLVNVNQNTWAHNWQKYQGKYLPNSLRFERNGWAAGWNVYDFKYHNIRSVVERENDSELYVSNMLINELPTYMLSVYDAEYSADILRSYAYNRTSKVLSVSNGTAAFDQEDDSILQCSFDDIVCNLRFDKTTHEVTVDRIISCDGEDLDIPNPGVNDPAGVTVNTELQKENNSYKLEVVRNKDRVDVNFDFKAGTFLECDQFIHTIDYKGFLGTAHKWNDNDINGTVRGSQYELNDDLSQLLVDGHVTNFSISNDNEITFDYTEQKSKDVSLVLSFEDYINEYSDLKLTGNMYDSAPLSSIAITDILEFNKIDADFSSGSLVAGSNSHVDCYIKVPLWLTVAYKLSDESVAAGALEPDNTYFNAIEFGGELDRSTAFKAINVFEPDVITEGTIADFARTSNDKVHYRYNKIILGNTIKWDFTVESSGIIFPATPYRLAIRDNSYWLGKLNRFYTIRNLKVTSRVNYWFGWHTYINRDYGPIRFEYTSFDFKFNPTEYFQLNDCFDANVATIVDPRPIRSVIPKYNTYDTNVYDFNRPGPLPIYPSVNYTFEPTGIASHYGDSLTEGMILKLEVQEICDHPFVAKAVKDIPCPGTLYTSDQPFTDVYDVYASASSLATGLSFVRMDEGVTTDTLGDYYLPNDGTNLLYTLSDLYYRAGTYEEVTPNFDIYSDRYWPFRYVPKFNVRYRNSSNDPWQTIKGVYAVYKKRVSANDAYEYVFVTDLNDFKKLIFGTYDNTINTDDVYYFDNNWISCSRRRIVGTCKEVFFDFDRPTDYTEVEEWHKKWSLWFPGVQDPQTLSNIVDIGGNEFFNKYKDFKDIEVRNVKVMPKDDYLTELNEYLKAHERSVNGEATADDRRLIQAYMAEKDIRMYFDFMQPGYVLNKVVAFGEGYALCLSCFNDLGIIPWKNLVERENDVLVFKNNAQYTPHIFHNHKDVTQDYTIVNDTSNALATITVTFEDSTQLIWSFLSLNSFDETGNITRESANFSAIDSTWKETIIQPLYSGLYDSLAFSNVNVVDPVAQFGSALVRPISYSISGGGQWSFDVTGDNTTWLASLHVENEAIESYNFSGNIAQDVVKELTYMYDKFDGVAIAGCFYGYAGIRVKYNDTSTVNRLALFSKPTTELINDESEPDNILFDETGLMTIESIPDTDVVAGKVYVDRDSMSLSYKWLKAYINDFIPFVTKFNVDGSDVVSSDPNNPVQLRFGDFSVGFIRDPGVISNSKSFKLFYGLIDYDANRLPIEYENYYPNVAGNINGHMLADEELSNNVHIVGVASSTRVPIGAEFLVYNTEDVNHIFYTDGLYKIRNARFRNITAYDNIGNDNVVSLPVFITNDDNADFTLAYNVSTGVLSVPSVNLPMNIIDEAVTDFILSCSSATVDFDYLSTDQDFNRISREVSFNAQLNYSNVHGRVAKILTANYSLTHFENNIYTICYNNQVSFDYSLTLNKLLDKDTMITLHFDEDVYSVNFLYGMTQTLFVIFNHVLANNTVAIQYRGDTLFVDLTPFDSDDNDTMSVEFSDIRLSDKSKYLGDINANVEYQIVKQQWDSTVEVENFWWVDTKHILELNTHYFVYKRNTGELDDWNGNRWEKIFEIPKLNIIGTEPCYYTVLNSYKSDDLSDGIEDSAYFLLVKETKVGNNVSVLRCTFYDIGDEFKELGHIDLEPRHHDLGAMLNTSTVSGNKAYLNTYSNITSKQILTQAKWTNTMRDNKIFLGCHVTNNFDQWTIVIQPDYNNANEITGFHALYCIQGYGYVSLTGDLTGGQIPAAVFSANLGFNSIVWPLSDLSKIDARPDIYDIDKNYVVANGGERTINEINNAKKVFGTAERQWYIYKEVRNIVSHLIYDIDSNTFIPQYLPITNTYEAVYKSPSFKTELLFDNKISHKALSTLFNGISGLASDIWSVFVSAALNPDIYLYAPKVASIIYLQQTFGQYAYVHYNSSNKPEDDSVINTTDDMAKNIDNKTTVRGTQSPLLSDEITFDKQIFEQIENMPYTAARQSILFLFNIFLPAIKAVDKKLSVNEGINWNTISETGDVFTQSVSENLLNVMTKSLHADSPKTGISSTVVGIKSLDMFYSTCEGQRVFAGPGFVEHQFVADCIAQSVTDVQVTSYVEQLSFVIKLLSTWKLKLAYFAEKFVCDTLQTTADYTASTTINGFGSGGNALGVAAAIVLLAGVQVAKLAMRSVMIAQEEVESLINTMADKMKADAIDSNIVGKTETEGKHKYGEKNEYFMWPCWGVPSEGLDYTDETVVACAKKTNWSMDLTPNRMFDDTGSTKFLVDPEVYKVPHSTMNVNDSVSISRVLKGDVPLYVASCYGKSEQRKLPKDMAKIEGAPNFLPVQAFKNQNISVSEPSFTPSLFQDYIIDKNWQLSQCVTYGLTQWVTCKDTKLINCAPSNIVITDDFCGVAAPYVALEIKRGLSKDYMRPYAVTPNVLAFNCTGYNSVLDNKLYHAFDGISYRIVDWTGSPGMNKNSQTFLYCFQINDRFKRSNKFPANEVQGNFDSEPAVEVTTIDNVFTLVTNAAKQKGMEGGTIGEDKDATRWAIPVFTELINTMPTAVKTLTAMQLNVYDGITALTTNIMNNQVAYKAPASIDFTIGKNTYRYTNDYICLVQTKEGIDIITEVVPVLGLTFIGSSLTEAYFYSKATRFFYVFTGNTLVKADMLERFRDVKTGAWDFINHDVVMPCLMSYSRLDDTVSDSDTETDNIIVPIMGQDKVSGELPPPLTTIFNDRSWYKVISLPAGLIYQGPNRVIINRNVFAEYMLESMRDNLGKWKKLDREKYTTVRKYDELYDRINKNVAGVNGWTYNPFILVTSPLGVDENTDCLFEWEITFCWPIEMDLLYDVNNYAVVNIMSETMTPGGKVCARPTHVYLTKELFTRSGNYGYYSFRYQSKNGAGNRERLHIWSDQFIAISGIALEYKVVTSRRTEILTQQLDIKNLQEL